MIVQPPWVTDHGEVQCQPCLFQHFLCLSRALVAVCKGHCCSLSCLSREVLTQLISHWLGASANSKRLNVLKMEQRMSISILSEMPFLWGGLNSLGCCGPWPGLWKQRNVFCYTHSSILPETHIAPCCAWHWGVDYSTLTVKILKKNGFSDDKFCVVRFYF